MSDILAVFLKVFAYDFSRRAMIAGFFVAVTASLIGVFLVLRKQALLTDGLAHISFASVAAALLLGWAPVFASLPVVIGASLLINKLTEKANMGSDAAIGLVSSFSVALGIILISLNGGVNVDINSYLFGSVLAVDASEMVLAGIVMALVVGVLGFFFNDLLAYTFDEEFAATMGIRKRWVDLCFAVLQSIAIIIGVKIVGALLMSSLVIFPAVSAVQVARKFRTMMLTALVFSVLSVMTGILISFFSKIPTGAGIVMVNAIFFFISFLAAHLRRD
jgi:ABC-type Mn2+/Zn2+ transport system permease subunit